MEVHRRQGTAFFPLMSILEGGVRFPVDPLLINTLTYYGLCPDQLPPNFYRVVSCVSKLNHTFNLQLDHHDINQMYSLCGSKATNYYLKTRDARVRLISCLPDSNRNSAGEFVRVRGNWFAGEIPCPLTRREVGSYHPLHIIAFLRLFFSSYWSKKILLLETNTPPVLLQTAKCLFRTSEPSTPRI